MGYPVVKLCIKMSFFRLSIAAVVMINLRDLREWKQHQADLKAVKFSEIQSPLYLEPNVGVKVPQEMKAPTEIVRTEGVMYIS